MYIFSMSCNSCKKKGSDNIIEEREKYLDEIYPIVNVTIGVIVFLSIYGFFSLLLDLFSLL
jgi:hypothetical protein